MRGLALALALGLAGLLALSACAPSAVYPDARVVIIDGVAMTVSPRPGQPGVYLATEERQSVGHALRADPRRYVRRADAIAAVAGCQVDPRSMTNRVEFSTAVAIC